MNIQKTINKLDVFQQKHNVLAFSWAVIKKYNDEQAGYLSALLTYYGYLSLFPLLLVLTTLTQMVATSRPELQQKTIESVASYFPVLGDQLSTHVNGLHKSGLALFVGILFLLYGTRGVAAAFRHGVNRLWRVPPKEQDTFPKSAYENLLIVLVGGIGFIVAGILAGSVIAVGHGFLANLISALVSIFILYWVFTYLFKLCLPRRIKTHHMELAALSSAVGIVVLQTVGSLILVRVLKNLDALYSYFALSLGLLFWIYLMSQVLFYSVTMAVVKEQKLWPRSLSGQVPTKIDKKITSEN